MTATPTADDSTPLEKALVCLTSFSCACLAFVLAAVLLLPLTAWLHEGLGVPAVVTQVMILLELFALPIVAALGGLNLGVRCVLGARASA